MNKFVKTGIDKDDLVAEYLNSINGLTKLSKVAMRLLIELVKLDINWVSKRGEPKNILSTENRILLTKKLNVTKDNLCTQIKRLRATGLVIKESIDSSYVRKELKPILIRDTVQVTFILKLKKDEKA